jgi:hypothetical protein
MIRKRSKENGERNGNSKCKGMMIRKRSKPNALLLECDQRQKYDDQKAIKGNDIAIRM